MGGPVALGLWGGRGDRKGLCIQGSEFARHMKPAKVMAFDHRAIGWSKLDYDWRGYEGAELTVRQANGAGPLVALPWLKGMDVCWGVETFYQDAFPLWAREAGVRTIQHVNPEFYRFEMEPNLPRPDVIVTPTTWRLHLMPGATVLPSPVNRNLCEYTPRPLTDGKLRFLHVVGHRAANDRNGTDTLIEALRFVKRPCRLLLRSQGNVRIRGGQHWRVSVDVDVQDRADYWTLYENADVLIMPRRYGGQCLPMQEAMSCGLPVIATDVNPQNEWLSQHTLVRSGRIGNLRTQAGPVDVYEADPYHLAHVMDTLSGDLDLVAKLSKQADRWASKMSWKALKPRYDEVIAQAVEGKAA